MMKIALVVLLGVAAVVQGTGTTEDKLVTMLMKDYNKGVLAGTTELKFSLMYLCAEVNKYNYQMTSRVLEKFTWTDTRLKWTPSEFNNINMIRFPANNIWTPDVKIFNSHKDDEMRSDVNVIIHSDGKIMWIPTTTYMTNCLPGTRNSFTCKLTIGSWTYDEKFMKMTMEGKGVDMSAYLDTCPHTITDIKATVESHEYPCCPGDKYPSMAVEFTVHDRI